MFDPDKIINALQTELPKGLEAVRTEGAAAIERVKTDGDAQQTAIGAAAVGALGALLLSGSMGKFGRKVATMGGLAALGTLAYQAWQKHGGKIDETLFLPQTDAAKASFGKANIAAIINAMKADGKIDDVEKSKLFERMQSANLNDEEKAFLFEELQKPIDTDAVVATATTPEIALSLYTASLVAINANGEDEKAYLANLAARLNLAPELVASLHDEAFAG
ncbi:MAG: hypothetical protein FD163_280 [Hyphomonadaceae bacterium]|nr:MAG: hypothetical protein FD163_280 [Hyphomonadaceae bacterium]